MDFPTNNAGASSSSTPEITYDVFLSFRGNNTRYGFTGNLYYALCVSGVYTFMDDEELPRGEEISRELPKAIEESRISIVVFSEDYATSRWCLDELVKILDCKKSNQQMVLPIFYNVDPREVCKQEGNFGRAMDKYLHEKGFNHEKVQRWRDALTEAANLSGCPRSSDEYEYQFIQTIVTEVSSKLNRTTLLHVADYPVGIPFHMQKINKLLQKASDDVCMLGIYGLGGIGKTTIAKAVYNLLVHHFEGHASFLANVRETSKRENGLVQLQDRLLSDIFGDGKWKVPNVDRGITLIKERLCGKKVLLILDDVDHLDQLEKLAVSRDSFGKGSIVIITTRNKDLLTSHLDDFIEYEVNKLNLSEACQLFSWHAFKVNKSMKNYKEVEKSMEDYDEFKNCAIRYADGHPLALKVLGSYLCGKSKPQWESALEKYKKNQSSDIHKILKISFDKLEDTEKDIFLDIACFFKGEDKNKVEIVLKSCNFYPESGIATLIDSCLITLHKNYKGNLSFQMHDLIQQMGWEIVRQESPKEPKKRSRLCFHEGNEDDLEVLDENKGLNKIQGIMLDFPKLKELQLSAKVFTLMKSLRVLIVHNAHFFEGFENLPDSLKWLDWPNYHFPFSLNSSSKNLVVFNMPNSHIGLKEPLNKRFENMTDMNLSCCKFVEKELDISGMPNLRILDVASCQNLVEVRVGFHDKLVSLNLENCRNLRIFLGNLKMESLEHLYLEDCSRLDKFPNILGPMKSIRYLCIRETAIKEWPSSIEYLTELESLEISRLIYEGPTFMMEERDDRQPMSFNIRFIENSEISSSLNSLPSMLKLSMLRELIIVNIGLSNLDFLTILGCFHTLQTLDLSFNNFVTIPKCIYKFDRLENLELNGCKLLQEIPMLPPTLYHVNADNCTSLNFKSRSRLLSEEFYKMKSRSIRVLGTEIPMWFNICKVGSSISFWANWEFSHYTIAFEAEYEWYAECCVLVCIRINGHHLLEKILEFEDWAPINYNKILLVSGVIDFSKFNIPRKEWNKIDIKINSNRSYMIIKKLGIHLYKCSEECVDKVNKIQEMKLQACDHSHLDWYDDVESNWYTQDRRSKGIIISDGIIISEMQTTPPGEQAIQEQSDSNNNIVTRQLLNKCQGTITSTSYQPLLLNEMILPGLDMTHVDSNDKGKGLLGLPVEMTNLGFDPIGCGGELALGSSSSVLYSNASNGLLDHLDAREGWPPPVFYNTEHLPFPFVVFTCYDYGSPLPLPGSEKGHRVWNNTGPMKITIDSSLGVQSTVNDGFDLGSSSITDPFITTGYDEEKEANLLLEEIFFHPRQAEK